MHRLDCYGLDDKLSDSLAVCARERENEILVPQRNHTVNQSVSHSSNQSIRHFSHLGSEVFFCHHGNSHGAVSGRRPARGQWLWAVVSLRMKQSGEKRAQPPNAKIERLRRQTCRLKVVAHAKEESPTEHLGREGGGLLAAILARSLAGFCRDFLVHVFRFRKTYAGMIEIPNRQWNRSCTAFVLLEMVA